VDLFYPHIIILATWIIYSCLEGLREAYYYHNTNISLHSYKHDLHPFFSLQRFCALFMLLAISMDIHTFILCGSLALIFPFFHDGFYYIIRHKLDDNIYSKGFFDDSYTSVAKIELNFYSRAALFFLGVTIFIINLNVNF
jgi:hypothetical protein